MRIKIILAILVFLPRGYVFAQYPTDWAVVSKGAFVIPSEGLPWTDPEGRAAGKRIGYMRVGTVVRVGACGHVNGPDDESTGTYCTVQSEVGVEGKTLKTRLFPLERGRTYAVARSEITLYGRAKPSVPRDRFSRTAGAIIEVVGDWHDAPRDSNVDVIATYNLKRAGALTHLAIRKVDLIERTYVIEVPKSRADPPKKFARQRSVNGQWVLKGYSVALWSIKPASTATATRLADKVLSDLGWDESSTENAQKLLARAFEVTTTILDKILCVTQIDASASAGFEFLGSGLKLTGKIPVYCKGKLFDFDVDVVERDGMVRYWILTTKTVICDVGQSVVDSQPKAIEKVSIFVVKRRPPTGSPTRLTVDGAKRSGLSIPDAVDAYNTPRLFIIGKFGHYEAARKFVAKRIANSDMLDQMTRQERIVLQHTAIAKLAYFDREAPADDID